MRFLCIWFFADDFVLVDDMRVGINFKLEVWRLRNLEGLRLSGTRTEYVDCNFSKSRKPVFLIIYRDKEIEVGVIHIIRGGKITYNQSPIG